MVQETLAALPPSLVTSEVPIPSVCYEKLITEVLEEWARKQPSKEALVDAHERSLDRNCVDWLLDLKKPAMRRQCFFFFLSFNSLYRINITWRGET